MNNFLKFLIRNLRTLDGSRGTADALLSKMDKQSFQEYKEKHQRATMSESQRLRITLMNEHNVFRRVYIKYVIMRVRAKISFIALKRRMTVVELFASTIQKCYYELQN
jgi:hypothetical protein